MLAGGQKQGVFMNGKWGPKDMISQQALTSQGMHCFLLHITHKNLTTNRTQKRDSTARTSEPRYSRDDWPSTRKNS